jgi:hypothetical protein
VRPDRVRRGYIPNGGQPRYGGNVDDIDDCNEQAKWKYAQDMQTCMSKLDSCRGSIFDGSDCHYFDNEQGIACEECTGDFNECSNDKVIQYVWDLSSCGKKGIRRGIISQFLSDTAR